MVKSSSCGQQKTTVLGEGVITPSDRKRMGNNNASFNNLIPPSLT
jgi:hypothetical protein